MGSNTSVVSRSRKQRAADWHLSRSAVGSPFGTKRWWRYRRLHVHCRRGIFVVCGKPPGLLRSSSECTLLFDVGADSGVHGSHFVEEREVPHAVSLPETVKILTTLYCQHAFPFESSLLEQLRFLCTICWIKPRFDEHVEFWMDKAAVSWLIALPRWAACHRETLVNQNA